MINIYILSLFTIYNILQIYTQSCRGTIGGANFDLSGYTIGHYYEVKDTTSTTVHESNVSFYFDFCEDVEPPRQASVCANTHDYDGHINSWNAVAFRHDHIKNECNRLSVPWNMSENIFSPLDGFIPSKGVHYSVRMGDKYCLKFNDNGTCAHGYVRNYQFAVSIRCADVWAPIPTESIIVEDIQGRYEVQFLSAAGCPISCPLHNGYICNDHGTCYHDTHAGRSRCFCNKGFDGDNCDHAVKTVFTSSTTGFMIVTIVLVVLIILFVAYIFYRLRKVNINPDSYESLENRFNQLGQMVS